MSNPDATSGANPLGRGFRSLASALIFVLAALGIWILAALPAEPPPSPEGTALFRKAEDIGVLLLVAAALIAGLPPLDRLRGKVRPGALDVVIILPAAILAVAFVADRALATKTAMLGGERHFWLDDDVMISMRYALNFASGRGLVWNAGETPVEGYSNFLWTIVLAIPHAAHRWVGFPLRLTSAFVIAFNALLSIGLLIVMDRAGRRLGLRPSARALVLLFIAANEWLVHWTASGSEAIALALLLVVAAERLLAATRLHPASWGVGLALGGAALLRTDGAIHLFAFAPAIVFLRLKGRARAAPLVVAALAPLLAHLLWRRYYYGDWLPNTYYLKEKDIALKSAMGVHYTLWLFYFWGVVGALALASIALARRPLWRALAAAPWAVVAFALLAGGDELPNLRFFVPALPLFALGAIAGGEAIFLRSRRVAASLGRSAGSPARTSAAAGSPARTSAAAGGFAWLVLALAMGGFDSLCLPRALEELGRERGAHERRNVEIGLLLRANTRPEARIAHYWAGAAAYFSERPAIDMLGKSDPIVARRPGGANQWQPGHVKYDTDYSLSLKPDVIVTALPADRLDDRIRAGDPGAITYPSLYDLFGHPEFRELYAGGLVRLPASLDHHGIYVRRDSTAALPAEDWREGPPGIPPAEPPARD